MFEGFDLPTMIFTVWLVIDSVFIGFDIWMRMRHEKWETELVPKPHIKTLQHFLEHDYELVCETKKYWVVRKFR